MFSNAAAAALGWGKWSWQVNHAEDLNGGAGTSQRDQTCSQVPAGNGWGTGGSGAAGGLLGRASERWLPERQGWVLHAHACAPFPVAAAANAAVAGPGTSSRSLFSFCRNLKIGYFSQHHVDQLDLNISAVELLARKFPGEFWRSQEMWAVAVSFATQGAAWVCSLDLGRRLRHVSAEGTLPALG